MGLTFKQAVEEEVKRREIELENEKLRGLLTEAEDDLYHTCLFFPQVESKTLMELTKELRSEKK